MLMMALAILHATSRFVAQQRAKTAMMRRAGVPCVQQQLNPLQLNQQPAADSRGGPMLR